MVALNTALQVTTKGLLIALTGVMIACSKPGSERIADSSMTASPQTASEQTNENSSLKVLRIVFPPRSGATELQQSTQAIAKYLSRELNMPVEAIIADDTAAVEALKTNRAEAAFLSSRPALKAEEMAGAKLYLAEVRPNYSGGKTYRSLIVALKDSPLTPKDSPKATLAQLKGTKIAFTSPTSGSGFIFPVSQLVQQGLVPDRDRLDGFFGQVSYGGDYGRALQAVLRGQADVAAVSEYALKAPYITAEESKRLKVIYEISGVPAHGVAIDDNVPEQTRVQLIAALQKLNEPQNNALLTNLYSSSQLVQIDHNTHLAPIKTALQNVGMKP